MRLNTGGAILSPQEIRNCSARMLGDDGTRFYSFLQHKAQTESFMTCTETMSQAELDKKVDEELVLRFFAVKNAKDLFSGNVRDWLDNYMGKILLKEINFDYNREAEIFDNLFDYFSRVLGAGSFVRYRGDTPIGALAPAYYEAITMGVLNVLDKMKSVDECDVKKTIIQTVQNDKFREYIGPGANTKEKLMGRIGAIQSALEALL